MKRLGTPPFVCLITEGEANSENYSTQSAKTLDVVRGAVTDGVSLVQVREKFLPARFLHELVRDAVAIARESATLIVVNDRADIAVSAGADGVHLPENSLDPRVVREAFGGRLVIGRSVHTKQAAIGAERGGSDYVFFGPVFETPGKGPAVGVETLSTVCAAVPRIPVIALGGIDETNCRLAVNAGAAGVAAIRSLNDELTRRLILTALR